MTADTPPPAPETADESGASDDRSAAEQLVELCVYAPIGLVLDARSLLPGLVERGRQQVGVARMVGEFAVKWGSVQLDSKIGDAQEQAMGLLRATGLAPTEERDRRAGSAPEPAEDTAPPRADTTSSEPPSASTADSGATDGPDDEVSDGAHDDGSGEVQVIDVTTLAIVDYDNLSASQVVPRLDGLTDDELEAVGRYEASRRGRNTILNKVAQLQSGE